MMKRERKTVTFNETLVTGPGGASRPATALEALMSAMPGDEPAESVEEFLPVRDAINECVELLDEQDRFVIEAVFFECVSLDVLGERLGVSKTHAWRLRNAALDKLKIILLQNPVVLERYGLGQDED
jgi:DNA-directed RNA polymerase sigma subunit (sigma70/sigma32)